MPPLFTLFFADMPGQPRQARGLHLCAIGWGAACPAEAGASTQAQPTQAAIKQLQHVRWRLAAEHAERPRGATLSCHQLQRAVPVCQPAQACPQQRLCART